MRKALGHVEVFLFACDGVGIGQHLVHATMLRIEHTLHLLIREACREVDGPVAEAKEELLGLFVATIHPGIAQACVHLMNIIKRYPRTIIGPEVTFLEVTPHTVAARHTAYIALAPRRVVLGVGIGTSLQLADEIVHTLATLLAACGRIDGHRRQIVAAYMSVETVPVRIGLALGGESGFLQIRCQQTVAIVLKEHLDVQVAGLLQGTVKQGDIAKWKLVGIEPILCLDTAYTEKQHQHGKKSDSFIHDLEILIILAQRYKQSPTYQSDS